MIKFSCSVNGETAETVLENHHDHTSAWEFIMAVFDPFYLSLDVEPEENDETLAFDEVHDRRGMEFYLLPD